MRTTWRPPQPVDYFVSYRSSAAQHARWCAEVLTETGHTSVVQALDFRPDDEFKSLIDAALAACDWMIALLTPSYFASTWCRDEWEEASLRGILVPVEVEDCALDGPYARMVRARLVGLDRSTAKRELAHLVGRLDTEQPRQPRIASPELIREGQRTSPWHDEAEWWRHPQTRPQITGGSTEGYSHEAQRAIQRRLERGDY